MNPELLLSLGLAVASALLCYAGVGLILPVLRARGVLDQPNHRSLHETAIPRGGGVPAAAVMATGSLVGAFFLSDLMLAIAFAGILAVGTVGLWEDVSGLSASRRLGMQLLASIVAGAIFLSVGNAPIAALPVVVLWLAGFTNVFNFMDGINGISGVTASLAGVWYVATGVALGEDLLLVVGALIAGSAIGFLPWNFPRPRVFLGDAGSYAFGFALAFAAMASWVAGAHIVVAVAPLLVYGLDSTWTLGQRAARGESLMSAHREHVYQRLVTAGFSHAQVVGGVLVATVLLCASALASSRHPAFFGLVALVVLAYLSCPRWAVRPAAPSGVPN